MKKEEVRAHFNQKAKEIKKWEKWNRYYYRDLEKLCSFLIPAGSSVLEVGCGTGNLLKAVRPSHGVGIDFSEEMVDIASRRHKKMDFHIMAAEDIRLKDKFDYIILSNLVGYLEDVEKVLHELKKVSKPETRIIITYYNFLWEPTLKLSSSLRFRSPQPLEQNWLTLSDLQNLLHLADFEVVKKGNRMLIPKNIPGLSWLSNKYTDKLPLFNSLALTSYIVARPRQMERDWKEKYSVSVVIPARNEKGNIEAAVRRLPKLGRYTEIIFVEGNSTDDTWTEIQRVQQKYKGKKDIKIMRQDGKGKGDAVRKGFSAAKGDILMILDADLTVRPEDLPKFYQAIASGKGEFINGCRLVYQMEKQAMRFLNMLGNKYFGLTFSWILDQRFKDTLCGTKVLKKSDYEKIAQNRRYFGDFDPFGDFDLIFGASKQNLKIIELPIRYQERQYGSTNISRFKHGLILLRMSAYALKKMKFL